MAILIPPPPLPSIARAHPRLSSVYPDMFCPGNYDGRGTCVFDYTDGPGTPRPKCQCFDESDDSAGCSDSFILDGKYLRDGKDLHDTIQANFFEPLIAVFCDHPDIAGVGRGAVRGVPHDGPVQLFEFLAREGEAEDDATVEVCRMMRLGGGALIDGQKKILDQVLARLICYLLRRRN
jgi:hypothetical protein